MIDAKLAQPARLWVLGLVGLGLCCAAVLASLTGTWSYDTFHHLALGRHLVRSGLSGGDDPFLFPLAGQGTGLMPYWLGSLAIYGAHSLLGEAGTVYLVALAGVALFLLLFWDALGPNALEGERWALHVCCAVAPLALMLPVYRERAAARPELFCNLFLALTLFALRRHDQGKSRLLYYLPGVALLWTNLHLSALLGAGVMFAYVAAGLGGRASLRLWGKPLPGTASGAQLTRVLVVALACTVAAAVNPSRFNPVVAALRFASSIAGLELGTVGAQPVLGVLGRYVGELQPLGPEVLLQPLGVLTLLTAGSFALAGRRAVSWHLLAVVSVSLLAVSSLRFGLLAAIAAAPVLAWNLGVAADRWGQRRLVQAGFAVATAALVAFGGWSAAHVPGQRVTTELLTEAFPIRAADYLARHVKPARLFNIFEFGGYLEWRLDRTIFQDGRGLLPAGEEQAIMATPLIPQEFSRWDERYRFDAAIAKFTNLDAAELAVFRSISHGGLGVDRKVWSLVTFDEGGLLFLRRDGAYAREAAEDEYHFIRPELPFADDQASDPANAARLRADLERAVAEAPYCGRCRVQLALALVALGEDLEAEKLLLPISTGRFAEVTTLAALGSLAGISERRGDRPAARRLYERALVFGLEAVVLRRSLAFLAMDDGDLRRASKLVAENLAESPRSRDDLVLAIDLARRDGRLAEVPAFSRRLTEAAGTNGADLLCATAADYERGGNQLQAVETFRSCLMVDPTGPLAGAARQALARLGAPQ